MLSHVLLSRWNKSKRHELPAVGLIGFVDTNKLHAGTLEAIGLSSERGFIGNRECDRVSS